MRTRLLLRCLVLVLLPPAVQAQANPPQRPVVRALQLRGAISIDGRLNEADWGSPAPASDFRQHDPHEGQPATQRTEVRFAYDADALYIGARMYDSLGAAGVRSRLARRDQLNEGDNIQFVFDTFHDHAGRTVFTVAPSGARADAGQASPNADPSWDPIWEVATQIDSLGWTAEMRIPFSQLRYPRSAEQTWGAQIWRFSERLNEVSMWSFWGKQEPGGPPLFGHIEGLQIAERKLGLEMMPYMVTRAEAITPAQAGSPLRDSTEYRMRFGADLKALLTSTLTLDATFNPDFGQVELDPAVVNLTQFETSFEEKRPFFIEGSGLFGFGGFSCFFCSNVSSLSLFYSRRIGRRPQGFVSGTPKFVEVPENSTILGAAKITGRTAGGLQIGVLNALTASEKASAISETNNPFSEEVEPLTDYFVGRVKKTFNQGNATVGAIGTGVVRRFENDALRSIMSSTAGAFGGDWSLWWKSQTYNLRGNFALSQVTGDEAVMLRLQRSGARYFDRPDRKHGSNGLLSDRYDPNMTTMRGAGAYVRMAKDAGRWMWETTLNTRTPGFEVNDLAFLTRADYVWMNANVLRVWTRPTKYYRQINLTYGAQQQYNFDGDVTDRQTHFSVWTQLPSWWTVQAFAIYRPRVSDDRLTRGGPVVQRASNWYANANINSDSRKKVVVSVNGDYGRNEEGATSWIISGNARFKPASSVAISLGPNFSRGGSSNQFVQRFSDPTASHFYNQRTVFADLTQRTASLSTRISAIFTPTLTLEIVAQPFIASGDFKSFKEFTASRGLAKKSFDSAQLSENRVAGRVQSYSLDPDRSAATTNFSFQNPDFTQRSLRGNAVLRWEYRPGSTLFLVWQQVRSGSLSNEQTGTFDFGRDAGDIFNDAPDNIFLVKFSYWLGR
jgi:hypothetical protein